MHCLPEDIRKEEAIQVASPTAELLNEDGHRQMLDEEEYKATSSTGNAVLSKQEKEAKDIDREAIWR